MTPSTPLDIALVLPEDGAGATAWPAERLAHELRAAGHAVLVRDSLPPTGSADVVHCLGVRPARALAAAGCEAALLLTPSILESAAEAVEPDEHLGSCAYAVVRSRHDQDHVHRLGISWARTWVLPGAVDTDTYRRVGPMANRTDRVRLITEMHGPGDGIEDVLTAMSRLEEVELVVLRGGAPLVELRDREIDLRAAASSYGVTSRVAVVAPRSDGERAWWLRSAHVAVAVPHEPRMGDFATQAMACGSAVVATPVDGLGDLVVHGVTGVNVPVSDPLSLARAVGALVADDFAMESQGIAAADRALSRFAWPRVVTELVGIYRRVAGEHAAPAPDDPSDEAALLTQHGDVDDAV